MKLFWNLNDYELLYLISEHNERAVDLMYKKYSMYIIKVINEMKVQFDTKDEYFQEGLIVLDTAIKKYDDKMDVPFFSYFNLILKRRLFYIHKEHYSYHKNVFFSEIINDIAQDTFSEQVESYAVKNITFKKEIDNKIYEEIILGNRSIKSFSIKYDMNAKEVYNKVYYLKKKLKIIYKY